MYKWHIYKMHNNVYIVRTPDYRVVALSKNKNLELSEGTYDSIPLINNEVASEYLAGEKKSVDVQEESNSFKQLYLILTDRCNMKCQYCSQRLGSYGDMSLHTMREKIDFFFKKSMPDRSVVLYGGEPLVHYQGVKYAIERIRKLDKKVEITIFTNGTLLGQEQAQLFNKYHVGVIVSLDGPPELNNCMRKFNCISNGTNPCNNTLLGIKNCKNVGVTPGISCVIGPHNTQKIKEATNFLCKLKPANIGMNPLHVANRSGMQFSPEAAADAIIQAAEIAAGYGIEIEQVSRRLRSFVDEKPRVSDCHAYSGRIVITPKGDFGKCEGAYPIVPEWFVQKFEDLKKVEINGHSPIFSIQKKCLNCLARGFCGGGCLLDAHLDSGCSNAIDLRLCRLSEKILLMIQKEIDIFVRQEHTMIIDCNMKRKIFSRFFSDTSKPLRSSSTYGTRGLNG